MSQYGLRVNGIQKFVGGAVLFADGTSGAPGLAFSSEPTLGFYRSSAANVTLVGNLTTTAALAVGSASAIGFTSRAFIAAPSAGNLIIENQTAAIGSTFKVDALPTVASGGGGTVAAAVTAGSTPLAGSVNVGTGVITSPIVLNFGGTAFPSAPFVVCTDGQTAIAVRATATTTQLTLTSAAFVANDVISWICLGSK